MRKRSRPTKPVCRLIASEQGDKVKPSNGARVKIWRRGRGKRGSESACEAFGTPPSGMYRNTLRRTGMALRGRASPAIVVGCHHPELRDYIAAQLRTGMRWERYRQWEVDHIRPLSSARTLSELIGLCHYERDAPSETEPCGPQ